MNQRFRDADGLVSMISCVVFPSKPDVVLPACVQHVSGAALPKNQNHSLQRSTLFAAGTDEVCAGRLRA